MGERPPDRMLATPWRRLCLAAFGLSLVVAVLRDKLYCRVERSVLTVINEYVICYIFSICIIIIVVVVVIILHLHGTPITLSTQFHRYCTFLKSVELTVKLEHETLTTRMNDNFPNENKNRNKKYLQNENHTVDKHMPLNHSQQY